MARHSACAPAEALGVVLPQAGDGLHDLALPHLGRLGELGGGERLGRQEEERLQDARELLHGAPSPEGVVTVIGSNGARCSQSASPAL